ncbi:MAG: copper homeostasis protein CutC [Collinsella sp.]
MLCEFCAENFERVPAAIEAGARRIELCDNLAVGGTTPSAGVISATVSYAHEHDARVMCMIRPRGGDFHYNSGRAAHDGDGPGPCCERRR